MYLSDMSRDIRDHSNESNAQQRHQHIKGKALKNILLGGFLYNDGNDKGVVTASAIVDDILNIIENCYRNGDNSFIDYEQWIDMPYLSMSIRKKASLLLNLTVSHWYLIRSLTTVECACSYRILKP